MGQTDGHEKSKYLNSIGVKGDSSFLPSALLRDISLYFKIQGARSLNVYLLSG